MSDLSKHFLIFNNKISVSTILHRLRLRGFCCRILDKSAFQLAFVGAAFVPIESILTVTLETSESFRDACVVARIF